jgi:tyrosyl-tRNA synthetase
MTSLVHGPEELVRVQAASQALFGQGDLAALDEAMLAAAVAAVPLAAIPAPAGGAALPTVADLMAASGIVASKSAARRAITEGGAYLNNAKVTAEDAVPAESDLLHGRYLILRRGKRTVGAVVVG